MSIFDDHEAKLQERFRKRMGALTDKQKEMHEEFPEFFEKCMMVCLTYSTSKPMRVRKEGTASKGTFVTGPVKTATPAYYRRAAKSVSMVFECQLETTHPANGSKHLHTVYLRRLPK